MKLASCLNERERLYQTNQSASRSDDEKKKKMMLRREREEREKRKPSPAPNLWLAHEQAQPVKPARISYKERLLKER